MMTGGFARYQKELQTLAQGRSVLHVGCIGSAKSDGTKQFSLHKEIAAHTGSLYGIDIDEEGIGEMKQAGFACERANMETFDSPRPFDCILVLSVLQFVPNPLAALQNMASCLAPGGYLGVHVPNVYAFSSVLRGWFKFENSRNAPKKHAYRFTEGQSPYGEVTVFDSATLMNLLTNAGLRVERITTCITKPVARERGVKENIRLSLNNAAWYLSRRSGPTLWCVAQKPA